MLGINYDSDSDSASEPEQKTSQEISVVSSTASKPFALSDLPKPKKFSLGSLPKPKTKKKKKKKKKKKEKEKKDKGEHEALSTVTATTSAVSSEQENKSVSPSGSAAGPTTAADEYVANTEIPDLLPSPSLDHIPSYNPFSHSYAVSGAPRLSISAAPSVQASKRQKLSQQPALPLPTKPAAAPTQITASGTSTTVTEPKTVVSDVMFNAVQGPSRPPQTIRQASQAQQRRAVLPNPGKPSEEFNIPTELLGRKERWQRSMGQFKDVSFVDVKADELTYKSEHDRRVEAFEDKHQRAVEPDLPAPFWDARAGKFTNATRANRVHKRKHQINSLAAQAAAMEGELAKKRAASRSTRVQARQKYGW